jgi:NAD(P)H dehydrogenase (quinone)
VAWLDRKRWAPPGDRNPCIFRSRRRIGTCELSARLLRRLSERVFDWSGVPVTHLRPTFCAQRLLSPFVSRSIAAEGVIRLPFGGGRHAPIAAEDVWRFTAAMLADPSPHRGKIYPLFGPVEFDWYGIAGAVGDTFGRTIQFVPIEIDDFGKALEQMGLWPRVIQHFSATARDYPTGIFAGTNDLIERVTGRSPMTIQAFIASHRDAFNAPPKHAATG